jgi:Fe-S-cluster containining protein
VKVVKDCISCHGVFCCGCIVVNIGREVPLFLKRITGLEALGNNPFLPLDGLLMLSDTPLEFYECTKLNKETGLCSIYQERPDMCINYPSPFEDDMLNFIFTCPWCWYRQKQLILRGEDYDDNLSLEQCMFHYSDPTSDTYYPAGTKDSCFRYTNYFYAFKKPSLVLIEEANDQMILEVLSSYKAHFAATFKQITLGLGTSRLSFQRIALLCYEFGVKPDILMNIVSLYGSFHSYVKTNLPFPSYIIGSHFKTFLAERLEKMKKQALAERQL